MDNSHERTHPLLNEIKKSMEALLEINDQDSFKVLRIGKLETARQKMQKCSEEERKVVKNIFLRTISPAFYS